ncbi:MAG: biotin--[Clostridia bacterium]|nr:biotin--[acetyl-CoA-carboxylase] ligase [Clostridia bacterium]
MEIQYFESLPSTNETAKAAAMQGASHLFTVVASRQTAGRGRMGRSFASPTGGTYFSTVLRPRIPRSAYGVITPFCAVAVHRAVRELAGVTLDIKWVNDLLHDGKKVCGILAEAGTDRSGVPFVVLGIGINTGHAPLPPELREIAASLPFDDREALVRHILAHLARLDEELERGTWQTYYRANASCLGARVQVIAHGISKVATALDVDVTGGLLVAYDDGTTETLTGGEISLRRATQ